MSDVKTPESRQTASAGEIKMLHQKTSLFRCIPADGAWVNYNSQMNVSMAFFNERIPLPESVYFKRTENGKMIDPTPRIDLGTDADWVRQFETEVIMSHAAAKHFHTVLGNILKSMEPAQIAEDKKQ